MAHHPAHLRHALAPKAAQRSDPDLRRQLSTRLPALCVEPSLHDAVRLAEATHGVAVALDRIVTAVARQPFFADVASGVGFHAVDQFNGASDARTKERAELQKVERLIPAQPAVACFLDGRIHEQHAVAARDVLRQQGLARKNLSHRWNLYRRGAAGPSPSYERDCRGRLPWPIAMPRRCVGIHARPSVA